MPDYIGKRPNLPEPNNTMYGGPTALDKVFYVILGVIMVAFLISLPFMYRDKQNYEAKQWHDHGCQMYDEYMLKNVPAKCQTYFIDHYNAQQGRNQPPDIGK